MLIIISCSYPSSGAKMKEQPKTAEAQPSAQRKGPGLMLAIRKHPLISEIAFIVFCIAVLGGFFIWQDLDGKIYIENAQITAPIISVSPSTPGILDKVYVGSGDEVAQGQRLAKVGEEIVTARTSGIITYVQNTPGQYVSQQTAIVKMFDPRQLRLVGRIQEDKGLSSIKPGQRVVFTVDAFGSKQYEGTVESVSMAARASDIVFSISDKRQVQEFEITAIFSTKSYPEFKDGMSAKMWVYK